MRKVLICFSVLMWCVNVSAARKDTVTRAFADGKGRVHIVTADGRDLTIRPEKGQEGVNNIQIAPSGKTVGWLVESSSSCCVSYPIPLELVVWRSGRIILRHHPSMAIWAWGFANNGTALAYRCSPLHGGWSGERVLVDIASGKTLATWDYPVDANGNDVEEQDADDNVAEPDWAKQIPEKN